MGKIGASGGCIDEMTLMYTHVFFLFPVCFEWRAFGVGGWGSEGGGGC